MSAADDETLAAAVELTTTDALAQLGEPDTAAPADPQPAAPRRRRSGTSRAERKAKAEAGASTGTPKAPRTRATRTPAKPRVNIAESMAQLYTLAGVGVSMAPPLDPLVRQAVGQALATQADACGQAWATLAKENERVRRALESLLTVSSVGVLLAAHVPIVLAGVQASAQGRALAEQAAQQQAA